MSHSVPNSAISRRQVIALGGGAALGGLVSAPAALASTGAAQPYADQRGRLPYKQIQEIVQAQGSVTSGVLSIGISRTDIGDVQGPLGVTLTPAFEIDGSLTFQPLGDGRAFFNGDIPVKPEEANPFIDALIANGLNFQAFHQHYIETSPNVWFIHFRGAGDAIGLAHAIRNALKATSTPLPQTMPSNPKTPFDAQRLGSILHGQAQVGDEGVVTVTVSRRGRIVIDGVRVSPEANISTNIEFKPLSSSGASAAAGPDFAMSSDEVQPVIQTMRAQGWFVGCLYNQETDEHPQLYFAHMLKTGDPYALAAEIRRGLDHTKAD